MFAEVKPKVRRFMTMHSILGEDIILPKKLRPLLIATNITDFDSIVISLAVLQFIIFSC